MRLEPVFLLAPEPKSAPTRRHLLWLTAIGCGSAMFGAGFVFGARSRAESPELLDPDAAILAHATALLTAEDDVLLRHRAQFLYACALDMNARSRLRGGMQRLAELALRNPELAAVPSLDPAERRALSRQILNVVGSESDADSLLSVEVLNSLRLLSR